MRYYPLIHRVALGLLLAALVFPAKAQVALSIGPHVGANVSTAWFPVARSSPNYSTVVQTTSLAGGEAGLVGSIRYQHLALQPGISYAQKGFNHHLEETHRYQTPRKTEMYDSRKRLNYLVFPLNLVLSQRATGHGVQVFLGAYAARLLGGTETTSYHTSTTTSSGSVDRPVVASQPQGVFYSYKGYSQRHDFGWQVGLGYQYRQWLLQTGYRQGQRNLAVDYSQVASSYFGYEPSHYNRAVYATLTYLFDVTAGASKKP